MNVPAQPSQRLSPLFARIARWVDSDEIDGAALAVTVGSELVAEAYFGRASASTPAGPDTLWPLACMTKVYTAAMVMALVDRGVLTPSTPASQHLPAFARDGRDAVRLRHLLTHTSGIPLPERDRVEDQLRRRAPLEEVLADACELPLLFAPGTAFHYTDHGYAVLGKLAEAATGSSYTTLMRELVLTPAGLLQTFVTPPADVEDRIAYVRGAPAEGTDGAAFNSRHARQLGHPGCCAVATIRDVVRFGLLFGPEPPAAPLGTASLRLMTTDQTGGNAIGRVLPLYPPQAQPWGFGFGIRGLLGNGVDDVASPHAFHHAGAAGSLLLVDPAAHLTIAFASNRYIGAGFDDFVARLSAVVAMVYAAFGR